MKFETLALACVLAFSACSHGPATLSNGGAASHLVGPQSVQNGGIIPFRKLPLPSAFSVACGLAIGGNRVWYTDCLGAGVGYAPPDGGEIVEYPVAPKSRPHGISRGPDGRMWFTESSAGKIGVVTQAGAISEYAIPTLKSDPIGIVEGPDSAMWFVEGVSKIGRVDAAGNITEYPLPMSGGAYSDLTVGADKNLWVCGYHDIARVTTAGATTLFPVPGCQAPTLGSDGRVYFNPWPRIALFAIDTAGNITSAQEGWDCNGLDEFGGVLYCLDDEYNNDLERFDVASQVALPPIPIPFWFIRSTPGPITVGPDGNMWFPGDGHDIAVYLRQYLTVTPKSVNIGVAQSQTITASETNFNGALSAFSQNPSIATVSLQSPGTFKVTGMATGSTIVVITDNHYNSFQVKVTVN